MGEEIVEKKSPDIIGRYIHISESRFLVCGIYSLGFAVDLAKERVKL